MAVTDLLCGQNGLFTQIKEAQTEIQQYVMLGKNFVDSIQTTITQIQTYIKAIKETPSIIVSQLQQEALNIITKEALINPEGSLAQILQLRTAYEQAGPAAQRVIDNLERFIKDPLNTPLDVCNDIPNLIKIGEVFIEYPKKAIQADPTKSIENIQEIIKKDYLKIFNNPATSSETSLSKAPEQVIRTIPRYPVPDVLNDVAIAGRVPINRTTLGPGSAHQAALSQAGNTPSQIQAANRSSPPITPSISNPNPQGDQYSVVDFAASKNATSIASKINTLDPAVRRNFAEAIKSFLASNPDFDINIAEGYRNAYGSANITSGLSPIQASAVKALNEKGITDPTAVSNILAQIQAESGFNPRSEEIDRYSAQTLYNLYGADQKKNAVRFKTIQDAQALVALGPEAVGNFIYGGRMGNSPNEGFKYRGRGLIQLTGKYNYDVYSKKVGVDLVGSPDLANDPVLASKIAVEYFLSKQKGGVDLKDINAVGQAVGYAGGQAETNKRAAIAKTFETKLAQNSPPPTGESWHNFGAAADIIVYAQNRPIPPESNSAIYTSELRRSFAPQGLANEKASELSHFHVVALGAEVPEDVKTGKVAFKDYVAKVSAPQAVATASTTAQENANYVQPLANMKVTSSFGMRLDPFTKKQSGHPGTDLAGKIGDIVKAPEGGTVRVTAEAQSGGYGNMVEILSGGKILHRLAHLSQTSVKNGDSVTAGTEVGKVGSTGRSTGPHLHWEQFDPTTNLRIDPIATLASRQSQGTTQVASSSGLNQGRPPTTVAGAGTTTSNNGVVTNTTTSGNTRTTSISVVQIQQEAKVKAYTEAKARGATEAQAQGAAEVAGNRAGAEALSRVIV